MDKMRRLWKNRKRQRGNALVMVIIAIAFIGMLVAMIVYSAYGNFLMKFNDYRAKDNFYSAETVMDIINAGMQVDISDSMLDAYSYATEVSEEEVKDSGMKREDLFKEKFASIFKDRIKDSTNDTLWDVQYFIDKYENGSGESVAASIYDVGAYIEAGIAPNLDPDADTNLIVTSNDILTFKNVRVTYTNTSRYVSVIQTDIRVKIPEMKTVQPQKNATLQEYCLIANDHLISDTTFSRGEGENVRKGGPQNVKIGGNVNAGKYGLEVGKGSKVSFENAAGETGSQEYYLVMHNMNVDADTSHGVVTNENYTTFVNDIKVNTSTADLNGIVYAADDLDISGKNSRVKLRGRYYGYGNDSSNSSGSSSFLINGANSTLDTSDLAELILAGNTFIGATSYDADTRRFDSIYGNGKNNVDDEILDVEEYKKELEDRNLNTNDDVETIDDPVYGNGYRIVPRNSSDLIMGGSIGAKAEQMLYLIPSDCVGYDHKSQEPVLNKNPMTKAEFDMLKNTTYTDETGEHPTYDIINVAKLNALGYTTNYKAIYRRINGTVLVYLYIDFGNSDSDAAAFLKSYYENNKEELNEYIEPYYNKVNSRIGSHLLSKVGDEYTNLYVEGNYFYYDAAGQLQMIDGNISSSAAKSSRVLDLNEQKSAEYISRLYTNKPDDAPTTFDVFTNTINEAKLSHLGTTTVYDEVWSGSAWPYTTAATPSYKAIVRKGDYVWDGSDPDICVVIATGDIYVNKDFNGLMIAGGDIILGTNCTAVNRQVATVKTALRNLCKSGLTQNNGFKLSDLFIDNVAADGGSETSVDPLSFEEKEEDENRSLGKYITYDNWRKE